MLVGSELLSKVKDLGDVSKSDVVRACGYVSTKADGGERLNFTAFYEALLDAKGISLGGRTARVALRPSRAVAPLSQRLWRRHSRTSTLRRPP